MESVNDERNMYSKPSTKRRGMLKVGVDATLYPLPFKHGGKIHINPANRGKFNATKAQTGKSTEELTHSENPLTKKRAIFAQNASKWKKEKGGTMPDANETRITDAPPIGDMMFERPNDLAGALKKALKMAPLFAANGAKLGNETFGDKSIPPNAGLPRVRTKLNYK